MDSKEKIEKLTQATCEYPTHDEDGKFKPCGKKQMMTVSLPLFKKTESGQLEQMHGPEGGHSIGVPFCDKHAMIMMSGHFGALEQDGKIRLHGPFEQVDLIRTVVSNMVMDGELQKMIKAVKKVNVDAKTNA